MDPITLSRLTVSLAVDVDLDYDSFCGKTPRQIAEAIEADLSDITFEISPKIAGVFTEIKGIQTYE